MTLTATGALPAGLSPRGAHAADAPARASRIPRTAIDSQLDWVIRVFNGGAGTLTEADLTAHVAPELLATMPAEQLIGELQQLATLGPFELQGFTRPPTDTQGVALLTSAHGGPLVLPITVEANVSHRITSITFAPVPAPAGVQLQPHADAGTGSEDFAGRFDIGGRSLYLACRGSGSPTVVLESGLGDSAAPWFAVESAVAGFTRVCSYDRANTVAGASDPAPMPRSGEDVVADLHALLRAAGVPGPYVLAGHSIGGHFARLYIAEHPETVAGLVLVDASHERPDLLMEALVGLVPASVERESEAEPEREEANPEGIDRDATNAQVQAARDAAPLPAMPLVAITAARSFEEAELPPGASAELLGRLWRELGADLAGLVPGSRQVIAERSGHYVHQSEPELVIDAIRSVVEAVRRQEIQL